MNIPCERRIFVKAIRMADVQAEINDLVGKDVTFRVWGEWNASEEKFFVRLDVWRPA